MMHEFGVNLKSMWTNLVSIFIILISFCDNFGINLVSFRDRFGYQFDSQPKNTHAHTPTNFIWRGGGSPIGRKGYLYRKYKKNTRKQFLDLGEEGKQHAQKV